mgnify:CR=1 FL=1
MRHRQVLLIAVIVAVVPAAVFGTGSFSVSNAERDTTVSVVGDSQAYMALAYSEEPIELTGSDRYPDRTFLTIGNNFQVDVGASLTSVDVTADDDLSVEPGALDDEPVEPGNELAVDTGVTCQSPGVHSATISFDVAANGDDVHAHTTEEREVTFDVHCESVVVTPVDDTRGAVGGAAFALLDLTDVSNQSASLDDVSVPNSAPISIVSASIDGTVEVECTDSTDGATESVTVTIGGTGDDISFTKEQSVSVSCLDPTPTPTPMPTSTPESRETEE